jgi:hypothetical protein
VSTTGQHNHPPHVKNSSTVPSKPDLGDQQQTTTFIQPQPPMTNQNPNSPVASATSSGMMNQHPMNTNINFGNSSENVSTNINFSMSNILNPGQMPDIDANSMLHTNTANLNQMDSNSVVQITPVIANTLINNMQMHQTNQTSPMDTTAFNVASTIASSNN